MKAILEFNLPEEDHEHRLALDGVKWMSVCLDLSEWLRTQAKHADRKTLSVSEVRERLYEEMEGRGLTFD